ncbi:MAG: DUF2807 domain-containing protein [Bacteroidaceae bacterium]|nr:DUF2807 domain-containing protein [Bacteroidaceae bacterium]
MKTRFILSPIVLLVALSILLSSCTEAVNKLATMALNDTFEYEREDTAKWGKIVEETLELPAFNSIDAEGVVCIVYTQDSTCSVRVRANEKCMSAYKYEVRKDELNVKLKDGTSNFNKKTPGIILYVTAPSLDGVDFSGGGKVKLVGEINLPGKMELELNGACHLIVDSLSVGSFDLETNGASSCSLNNITTKEDIEIEINGAGNINANVFCQDLRVELNGASQGVFTGECKKLICEENGASKVDFSNLKK